MGKAGNYYVRRFSLCGKERGSVRLPASDDLKVALDRCPRSESGESVGYGGTWTSQRDTKIGVIAIGYGDGYPRTAPNGTPVVVNGRRVPIAGRVSMDMLTVDLGPDACDRVGDEAMLWGNELPVEEVAAHIGTIGYELVTKLTSRVEMSYYGAGV